MERGGGRGTRLDPAAPEFHPAPRGHYPQFYHPLPPPPPPPVAFPAPSAAATRAVVLSMVPQHVSEAEVREAMKAFGGVQAVDMGALATEGVVTVHFYDLRSAHAVVAAVWRQQAGRGLVCVHPGAAESWGWFGAGAMASRNLHYSGGPPVWAQFAAAGIDEPNQGFILVLNLHPNMSCSAVAQIFEAFGAVKEVMEVPSKQHHKMVEFYDKRDAARAMSELNGKDIHGRRLALQFAAAGSQMSIYSWKKNNSTHCKFSFPPRLVKGSKWIRNSNDCAPTNPLSSSSPKQVVRSQSIRDSCSTETKKKENTSPPPPWSKQLQLQQHQRRSGRGGRKCWKKNHSNKEGESGFLFKEMQQDESSCPSPCRDSRTTVMIRNIPNKYSQKLLLDMLDDHCLQCNVQIGDTDGHEPYSAYDFVYLPIDFINKCNVGYGFVNMTSPEAAFRLYKAFHQRPWDVFNSRKICQITYARLQGLEALMAHFKSSNLATDKDEYMPVAFSPPRDGKQLPDPVLITGRATNAADLGKKEPPPADRPPLRLLEVGGTKDT
ncbi:protein terminal ear1 [Canna indica]|uniref:Protein terminal ear1 n=1 Tax=Canna indica TaxID=4628 RepID=A0AAQ3K7Q2_9LILI|nr:protein terminal ear1 [Canna indica]